MEKVLEFLRGAHEMDKAALECDYKKNLPLLSALLGIWNHNFLKLSDHSDYSLFSSYAAFSCAFAAV